MECLRNKKGMLQTVNVCFIGSFNLCNQSSLIFSNNMAISVKLNNNRFIVYSPHQAYQSIYILRL